MTEIDGIDKANQIINEVNEEIKNMRNRDESGRFLPKEMKTAEGVITPVRCTYCDRPTIGHCAVCKKLKCRVRIFWDGWMYSRAGRAEAKREAEA